LACTWIVGIGRYWDNPRVELLQKSGIGSIIYVFALSFFLWLLVLPLKPKDWNYFRVLTFIALVSPPAILYSIPIELFTDIDTSNGINAIFLLIVSLWRVALLLFFLKRLAGLNVISTITVAILPICLIVVGLVVLNLEKVVLNIMGGMDERSPNDTAYLVLNLISLLSILILPFALISYIVLVIQRLLHKRKKS
jgi:hypothetical protein